MRGLSDPRHNRFVSVCVPICNMCLHCMHDVCVPCGLRLTPSARSGTPVKIKPEDMLRKRKGVWGLKESALHTHQRSYEQFLHSREVSSLSRHIRSHFSAKSFPLSQEHKTNQMYVLLCFCCIIVRQTMTCELPRGNRSKWLHTGQKFPPQVQNNGVRF